MKRDEIIEGVILFLCGGATVILSIQMPSRSSSPGRPAGQRILFWPIRYPTLSVEAGGTVFVRPDILEKD